MLSTFLCRLSHIAGRPITFVIAAIAMAVVTGIWQAMGASDAGLNGINLGVSYLSLLLLFSIQHTQNRDGAAEQAKLDELIRSSNARNDLIGAERLSEEEVTALAGGKGGGA